MGLDDLLVRVAIVGVIGFSLSKSCINKRKEYKQRVIADNEYFIQDFFSQPKPIHKISSIQSASLGSKNYFVDTLEIDKLESLSKSKELQASYQKSTLEYIPIRILE